MNHTSNYNLSQWEKSDRVLMDDFNADNAAIDAALKAEADARAAGDKALQTALNKKGNCRMALYTYTGTGTVGADGPCTIPFTNGEPILVLVMGGGTRDIWLHQRTTGTESSSSLVNVNWSETGVSWYAYSKSEDQLNYKGSTYIALMIYKLD